MSVVIEEQPPALAGVRVHPGRARDLAAVAIPTALALALCLYQLSTRSLWLDEAATISIASQHGSALGAALAHDGGNMLGYYGLVHVLIGMFGSGAVVVRLPSALAAAATVGITSVIALRLFNRRIALVAGGLGAVSLPLVYWGQDARGYMLMIALVSASFLLLVVALQRAEPGRWLWLAYVAVMTAAVYAGLEAVLVWPAQLMLLAWHRRRVSWVLSAMVVSAACCIPLAILALDRGASQIFWIPHPNAFTTRQVLLTLSSAGLEPQFYSSTSEALRLLTEVLVGAAVGATVWHVGRTRTRPQAWRPLLAAGWLVIPPILAWVISELGRSMFEARYLLLSLPALALLLAWLIVNTAELRWDPAASAIRGEERGSRWRARLASRPVAASLRLFALALLAGLLTLRAIQLVPAYGVSTEPWRKVTAGVLASGRPGDCVAFYPLDTRMPFRYYLPANGPAPRPVIPALPWSQIHPFVEDYSTLSRAQVAHLPAACPRLWLISSHQGRNAGTAVGRRHYQHFLALSAALAQGYLHSSSTTFGAARIVTVERFSGPIKGHPSPAASAF
ncbi:MAG: glycosyltransferase family 39 protein [Solirubrobacteraceae bacterium]